MAVFGSILSEGIVQVNDKTRIDVKKTFSTPDESITLLEVDPDTSGTFYDVTTAKYIDYSYPTDGTQTITLRVTGDVSGAQTFTKAIEVLTEADDQLFSSDEEIVAHENDILKFLPKGRASFKDKHRAAQDRILGYLDEKRIWDCDGNRLTKANIVNNDEVNDWSKFMVLQLIFEDASNSVDDIFYEKSQRYRKLMVEARNRAVIRLDIDNDGSIEKGEAYDLYSVRARRR